MGGSITYGTLENLNISLGSGGNEFTVNSSAAGATNLITGNTGVDIFNIRTIGGTTTVNAGDSSDTINIGSNASGTLATPNTNTGGNLNSILGLLTVNGNAPPAADVLNVDDTSDASSNTGILTSTTITGLDMAAGGIVYGSFEVLNISLGSGGNNFTVSSTHNSATVGTEETTTLNTGLGADVVSITTTSDTLTVNGQNGDDVITVISTGTGSTTTLNGDDADDVFNIRGINGVTTINGGNGSDTTNVGSTAAGTIASPNINSGGNVNSIGALLTVNGDANTSGDVMNVDDTADAIDNVGTLSATTLIGMGMGGSITYGTLETLNINFGSGNDVVNVVATALGAVTNINTNAGNESIYVSTAANRNLGNIVGFDYLVGTLDAIQGDLNIAAGTGSHTLMISDEDATVGDTNVVIDDPVGSQEVRISGLAPAAITFGAAATVDVFGGFTIWTGSGDDTIDISATMNRATRWIVTTLNTGLGNDDVTVNLTAGSDGFFVLNTQGADYSQPAAADDDIVDGSGSSLPLVIFGGQGVDNITGGSGANVIFGDSGRVYYMNGATVVTALGRGGPGDFTDAVIRPVGTAFSEVPTVGGNDTIVSGNAADIIVGGFGADTITANNGANIIFGDNGDVDFYGTGVIQSFVTTDPTVGDVDNITSGTGADIISGGAAGDTINAGSGNNVVLGENGQATFTASGSLLLFLTTDATVGGVDNITTTGGNDVISGGTGGDTIAAGAGNNIILAENGRVDFDTTGPVISFVTSDPTVGGDDIITSGTGRDIISGGVGSDNINAGDGNNVILGESGQATFGLTGNVILFETTSPLDGGIDSITTGSGNDTISGGIGSDTITAGDGNNIILAENGRVDFYASGVIQSFVTTSPTIGGDDIITSGTGRDIISGGVGSDSITAGNGDNVILGESGEVTFGTGGLIIQFKTTSPNDGGIDTITTGSGNDTIAGGIGGDTIDAAGGNNIIFAENGQADFFASGVLQSFVTSDPTVGGNDIIITGAGRDVISGGVGADDITAGDGDNVVFGESGQATFTSTGSLLLFETLSPLDGGIDDISAGSGNDTIAGGLAGDTIAAGDGNNIILGESGRVDFYTSGVIQTFYTTNPTIGDNDTITSGTGRDIIAGGIGADSITAGAGDNVIFGDSGTASFGTTGLVTLLMTTDTVDGGNDTILTGVDDDIIAGGFGADGITAGDGDNIILGDNGQMTFNSTGILTEFKTTAAADGGIDTITAGTGDDIIAGGTAGDSITADEGDNIVLGDNGEVDFDTTGPVISIVSTDISVGGDDTITAGDGRDIISGGVGADNIMADDGNNVVFGDNGEVTFGLTGLVIQFKTTVPAVGGIDIITVGAGNDLIAGGIAGETIAAGEGNNIVLGDHGQVDFNLTVTGPILSFVTTDPTIGGDDTITSGAGRDIIAGGVGVDGITAGNGNNIILGDNGEMTFNATGVITQFKTTFPLDGGVDTIVVGIGNDIIAGGTAGDSITGSEGNNIILGDNGQIDFDTTGPVTSFVSTDFLVGGNDTITVGAGRDIISGGFGLDSITAGEGDNVVFGDHGTATFGLSNLVILFVTTAPTIGDDDSITAAAGRDIIAGGLGADSILVGNGDNVVFGDNGEATFGTTGDALQFKTTFPGDGGIDIITVGIGNDLIAGGTAGDTITGDEGNNIILGDNGQVDFDTTGPVISFVSTDFAIGGDDTISVGAGRDIISGGFGLDSITAGEGDNVVFGDHGTATFGLNNLVILFVTTAPTIGDNDSITAGAGRDIIAGGLGADSILVGDGNNVVLGDNGETTFGATGDVLQFKTTFPSDGGIDTITVGAGNDLIAGGTAGDIITGGEGNNIIFGDNGQADFHATGPIVSFVTTDPTIGGDDTISVGAGRDIIAGGVGADGITAGNGDNVVFGDNGTATFGLSGYVILFVTTSPGDGGVDTITAGTGDDLIAGGTAGDSISADEGDNIILGDNGQVDFYLSGPIMSLVTQAPTIGGDDTISVGTGRDIIAGGVGSDGITASHGDNVIFGDNGYVTFGLSGDVILFETTFPSDGGIDTITAGMDDDLIAGGTAGDSISADEGDNIVLGDNGWVDFDLSGPIVSFVTAAPTIGGDDTITVGAGRDIIAGGVGADNISGGNGDNVVLGDNGQATFGLTGFIILFKTTFPSDGGADIITVGIHNDTIAGGTAGDTITADEGNNIVLGDNGQVDFYLSGPIMSFVTTAPAIGGNDTITAGDGRDIIAGGFGADSITANDGQNVIHGDNGEVTFWVNGFVTNFITTNPTIGDDDTITTGVDRDIIAGGATNDTITAGDGDNIVFGDHGNLDINVAGHLNRFETLDPAIGGDDTITTGDGQDIIAGGTVNDGISADDGENFVFGDNGEADLDVNGRMIRFATTYPAIGGVDNITTGVDADFVMGGTAGDTINASEGENFVLGDNGVADFDLSGRVIGLRTTDPTIGDNDTITTGDDADVIMGGTAADIINAGSGDNFVLGDNGVAVLDLNKNMSVFYTTDPTVGDDDTITTGTGSDTIIGGTQDDLIQAGAGNDFVIGDNGIFSYPTPGTLETMISTDPAIGGNDTIYGDLGWDIVFGGYGDDLLYGTMLDVQPDMFVGDNGYAFFVPGIPTDIHSIDPTLGGNDTITTGLGAQVVIGGMADDIIHAGGDALVDMIIGDNGRVLFNEITGVPVRVETTDPAIGGVDTIDGGDASNVIMGGIFGDTITVSNPTARAFILGDNGQANLDLSGAMIRFATTDPSLGGDDTITTLGASDIIAGGVADDRINAGGGNDYVLGDNGVFDFSADAVNGTLDTMFSTDQLLGGNDTIYGEDGEDVLFGGTGSDFISGGNDHDLILGDHGFYDVSLPVNQNFGSLFTGPNDGAGDDTLYGDAADDFIMGQQGGDLIFGGAGQDNIVGGHNVLYGSDGDDIIDGGDAALITVGDGADVILGDNGVILRDILGNSPSTWRTYLAPYATTVIRTVIRFDDIDLVAGDDRISGDAGEDIIHGQRGDDVIDGGTGDDELIGGPGSDIVSGDEGNDIALGGSGTIYRAFNTDGTPHIDVNGSWHRDILIEDIGTITGVIRMDVSPLRIEDPVLASKLLLADIVIIGGSYTQSGVRVINSDTGAWNTELILIDLLPADNDMVNGGAGDDLLFGQRGDDIINGDAGDDLIFADGVSNSVPYATTVPQIASGIRIVGVDAGVPYEIALGGQVIVPNLALQPLGITTTLPQISLVPNIAFGDLAAADTLQRNDGSVTLPMISFVPDLIHGVDALPGNDVINGGSGADTIYGDDVAFSAPLFNGISALNEAEKEFRDILINILGGLHALSLDHDLLGNLNGSENTPHDVRIGNDTIEGGDGNDYIIADNAIVAVAFAVGGNLGASPDFVSSVLRYYNFIRDLEYVAADFLSLVQEAHVGVLHELVAESLILNPTANPALRPAVIDSDYHRLLIGNDRVDGGFGNDVIIGDEGGMIAAVLTGTSYSSIAETLGVDPDVLADAIAALNDLDDVRDAELLYHKATNLIDWSTRKPTTVEMSIVPAVFEYDMERGNDILHGGRGDDLLIGDKGVVVVAIGINTTDSIAVVQNQSAQLLTDLESLLGRDVFAVSYALAADRISHDGGKNGVTLLQGADQMNGGAGDDILLSKSAASVVNFSTANPTVIVTLQFGLSHVDAGLLYLEDEPLIYSGRNVNNLADVMVDNQGDNKLLIQTGNLSRESTNEIRNRYFNAFTPAMRQFLVDTGLTGGDIAIDGDLSVLPPGGTVHRDPTLDGEITATPVGTSGRNFDLTATLNGTAIPANFAAVWQILNGAGTVVASGVGSVFAFNASVTGTYRIQLILTDLNTGTYGISYATIQINTAAGTFTGALSGPKTGVINQAVEFYTVLPSLPAGYTAAWEVRDSANTLVASGAGDQFTFTPGAVGQFTVTLVLTQTATSATTTLTSLFDATAPAALSNLGISGLTQGINGKLMTFDALLNGASFSSDYTVTWRVFDIRNRVVATGSGSQFLFLSTAPGQFRVELQMVDQIGGLSGVTSTVVTINNPVPVLTAGLAGPSTGVRGEVAIFQALLDNTSVPAGYTASWVVLNSTSQVVAAGNSKDFSFVPEAAGAYTIALTLVDTRTGAVGYTVSTLVISIPVVGVTAAIIGPTQAIAGANLIFTGILNGELSGGNYSTAWTVRNTVPSTVASGTGNEFGFSLLTPGTYTVEFAFTDLSTGAVGSAIATLTITALLPSDTLPHELAYIGPSVGKVGQTLNFLATMDNALVPAGYTATWTVTDAASATVSVLTGSQFTFVPATAGTHNVTLVITDLASAVVGTLTSTLQVGPTLPTLSAGLVGPINGVIGQNRTFNALLPGGVIPAGFTGAWELTDSTSAVLASGTGTQLTFSVVNAGAYTVRFTLTETVGGAYSTTTSTIQISAVNPPLSISFIGPVIGAVNQALTFRGLIEGNTIPVSFISGWEVFDDSNTVIASVTGTELVFTPSAAGNYRVEFTVADPVSGGLSTVSTMILISPAVSTLVVDLTGPVTAIIGQPLTFNGLLNGVAITGPVTTMWSVTDLNNAVVAQGSGNQFTFAPTAAGEYSVRFTVVDATGAFGSESASLNVSTFSTVAAPALGLGITGPDRGVTGQVLAFHALLNSTPIIGNYESVWHVLDSANMIVAVGFGTEMEFAPMTNDTFSVVFTLENQDTGVNSVATHTLTISRVLLVVDNVNPLLSILMIGGSTSADTVNVTKLGTPDTIAVSFSQADGLVANYTQNYTFSTLSRIEIYGGMGDDVITINTSVDAIPTLLSGGPGRDTLTGGKGNDTILGGFGDDLLVGGEGNDIMNGGFGSDLVKGGIGNDSIVSTEGDDVILGEAGIDTIYVQTTRFGQKVSVDGGTENDTVNIAASHAGSAITVITGAGTNVVNIGSSAGLLPAVTGLVDAVKGTVKVIGNSLDTVNVDDTANLDARSWTLSSEKLNIVGGGEIGTSGIGVLNIGFGSGNDHIFISGTSSVTTNVKGNAGNEVFDVIGTGSGTTTNLLSNAGSNELNVGNSTNLLGNIKGLVNLTGNGTDAVKVSNTASTSLGTGSLTSTDFLGFGMGSQGVHYTGVATMGITLGSGAETITVESTGAVTAIDTGAGNDTVNIRATSHVLDVTTGVGVDTVALGSNTPSNGGVLAGITATLNLNGSTSNTDIDTLKVDDGGNSLGGTGVLTLTALTGFGLGAAVNYTKFEAVVITLGSGNDNITLSGGSAAYTTVNAGGGTNVIS